MTIRKLDRTMVIRTGPKYLPIRTKVMCTLLIKESQECFHLNKLFKGGKSTQKSTLKSTIFDLRFMVYSRTYSASKTSQTYTCNFSCSKSMSLKAEKVMSHKLCVQIIPGLYLALIPADMLFFFEIDGFMIFRCLMLSDKLFLLQYTLKYKLKCNWNTRSRKIQNIEIFFRNISQGPSNLILVVHC